MAERELIEPKDDTNINTKYTINTYTQTGKQIIINNWLNNYDENTKYFIDYDNIKYQVVSFTNNNFILTLNMNDIINFNCSILPSAGMLICVGLTTHEV